MGTIITARQTKKSVLTPDNYNIQQKKSTQHYAMLRLPPPTAYLNGNTIFFGQFCPLVSLQTNKGVGHKISTLEPFGFHLHLLLLLIIPGAGPEFLQQVKFKGTLFSCFQGLSVFDTLVTLLLDGTHQNSFKLSSNNKQSPYSMKPLT